MPKSTVHVAYRAFILRHQDWLRDESGEPRDFASHDQVMDHMTDIDNDHRRDPSEFEIQAVWY